MVVAGGAAREPKELPGPRRVTLGRGTTPTTTRAQSVHNSVLSLQQRAGNRAIAGLLSSVPRAIQRRVGWSDASKEGHAWNAPEGRRSVGKIRRIPLEGLKHGLEEETAQRWVKEKGGGGHWEKESTMIGALSPESAKGKAIVLVPESLNPKDEIEVLVHLHGYTEHSGRPFAGWRALSTKAKKTPLRQGVDTGDVAPVRDVALDQAAQQLEESENSQTVVVLPQGGLHSQFGKRGDYNFDSGAYVSDIVSRLQTEGVWETAPKVARISMAGHSGAGATLSKMARESVDREAGKKPGSTSTLTGDLVLFDAIYSSTELQAFQDWALMRLNQDLAVLKGPGSKEDKLGYLRTAQKLLGYYSKTPRYRGNYEVLDGVIQKWFKDHAVELGAFATSLRANFAIVHIPVGHEELMRGVPAGQARNGSGGILDALRKLHPPAAKTAASTPAPAPAAGTVGRSLDDSHQGRPLATPTSAKGLVQLQQLAGNVATGRHVARQPQPRARRTPQNDPAQLATADLEELFRLYLSGEAVVTLQPSGATYSRRWIGGARGSAQIRDVIREELATKTDRPELRQGFLQEVTRLGGPDARRGELNAAINATFDAGARLEESLLTRGTRRLTRRGFLHRLRPPQQRTNTADRPQFILPASAMEDFEDTKVHPAVVGALQALMNGLRAEGARLNDQSALQARVTSGHRPTDPAEGTKYLEGLKKTIRLGKDNHERPYTYPPFPASLEETARSELGVAGSPAYRAFRDSLAAAPGWTGEQADMLLLTTAGFKAPRGGSTHHSGVTVDINWPVLDDEGNVVPHGIRRERNGFALRSVAGRWLYEHAPALGFDTYNTHKEIWHMEWRQWRGTAADPDASGG